MTPNDIQFCRGACIHIAPCVAWSVVDSGNIVTLAARFPDDSMAATHVRTDGQVWPLDVLNAAEALRNAWIDGATR